jgi:hypothetical protein
MTSTMRPRARRHHDDAIGELDRLVDVVRDEEYRFLLTLPDSDELSPASVHTRKRVRAQRMAHPSAARWG